MAIPILAPGGAMHEAIASYLASQLSASLVLDDTSIVEQRWPEPTEDLQIALGPPAKIRIGITRVGAARGGNRIGGPVLSRLDVTASPAATARYDFDEVAQDYVLGVWSPSQRIRDEVDEIVSGWLSQPFWSTIAPIAGIAPQPLITLTAAITKTGRQTVSVSSMANVWYRTRLKVGTGAGSELVDVEDLAIERGQLTFVATFTKTHASGVSLVEVAARRDYAGTAANNVYLRVPLHFNALANFDFDEPSNLDEERGQRQEWMSMRHGVGTMRHIATFGAIVQTAMSAGLIVGLGPDGTPGTTRTVHFK